MNEFSTQSVEHNRIFSIGLYRFTGVSFKYSQTDKKDFRVISYGYKTYCP